MSYREHVHDCPGCGGWFLHDDYCDDENPDERLCAECAATEPTEPTE